MNNKEYGVKLNADIKNFVSKLNDAKEYTNQVMEDIKEKIKEPMEEVGEASKNSFTGRLEEIGKLSGQMAQLTLDYANAVSLEGKQSEKALELKNRIRELNDEIGKQGVELEEVGNALDELFDEEEKATSGMSKFGSVVDSVKSKGQTISVAFFRFGDDISKSVMKGVNSLKRFSLSLLGIHSLYSMLSRATNAYMSQDEKLHTRMQANWIALGAMLAPIIEKIITLFQRLVAYVNVFWKAFTGKNLIDIALKKVQKTAKGTTKAVKELNKELSNIDEITNLNFDQTGGNIDAGGGDTGYGIEDALNEIKNLKLNPEIVKIMEWIGKKLRKLIFEDLPKLKTWLKDNEDIVKSLAIAAGVLYGAFKLTKIYNGIAKIIGVSGGTTGLLGMLTVFGMLVDFALAHKLGKELEELSDALYDKKDAEKIFADTQIKLLNTIKEKINENNQKLKDGNLTDKERQKILNQNETLMKEAKNTYTEYLTRLKKGKTYTKEQREEIEKQTRAIEKVSGKTFKTTIKAEVQEDLKKDSFIYKLMHNLLPEIHIPGKGGGAGTGFAKGNVAYQPTQAVFGEYAGARSNPEITAPQNMIRETLFEALSDALPLAGNGGGDTILYVNGKELARATYGDFQNERNRIGSSNVAVRRV